MISPPERWIVSENFGSPAELEQWLRQQGIDPGRWRKSVAHLWTELTAGESQLQANPPLRFVQVVQIIIRRGQKQLIEVQQQFDDETTRQRVTPPAEKIKGGEDYLTAAGRGLAEELGLTPDQYQLLPHTYQQKIIQSDSPSFAGLATCYTIHLVEVNAPTLPITDFYTIEGATDDPVSKHFWGWKAQDDLPLITL